jgi:hypothetical protein
MIRLLSFFENSPETSRLNFAYEIDIIFRLLLLSLLLPCFPSNSCVLYFLSLIYVVIEGWLYYVLLHSSQYFYGLSARKGLQSSCIHLCSLLSCLSIFPPIHLFVAHIFVPPYLHCLRSYVFRKICVSFHNMSSSLAATVSLNFSSFSPLHVYSSHFFPWQSEIYNTCFWM